jgi:hypothetical protein
MDAPDVGAPVLWRSIPDAAVSYVYAGNLVACDEQVIAIFQPVGAPTRKRTGRRGGPRGCMVPGGWDGGHAEGTWSGAPNVRLHVRGLAMAVIRGWDADAGSFRGWYVNLEMPWQRSPVGFDSRDLILDVTAADDLSGCSLKDDDQLSWVTEQGGLTAADAAWIREQGRQAAQRVARREFPFDADWSRFAPEPAWPVPQMPTRWNADPTPAPLDARTSPPG